MLVCLNQSQATAASSQAVRWYQVALQALDHLIHRHSSRNELMKGHSPPNSMKSHTEDCRVRSLEKPQKNWSKLKTNRNKSLHLKHTSC
eukprot:1831560-Alexandrium_andersonii.AAC.1